MMSSNLDYVDIKGIKQMIHTKRTNILIPSNIAQPSK